MTLNLLLASIKSASPGAPVVFIAGGVEIRGDYHVTELKHAKITSIDCDSRLSEWTEASMQLLDGNGGAHMAACRLAGILAQSIRQVEGLGDAQAHMEFAPGNEGMGNYKMQTPEFRDDRVLIQMDASRAACKPAQEMRRVCGPSASSSCC